MAYLEPRPSRIHQRRVLRNRVLSILMLAAFCAVSYMAVTAFR